MANIQPGGPGPPPKRLKQQAKLSFCRKEGTPIYNYDLHVRRLTRIRPLSAGVVHNWMSARISAYR